MRKIGPVVLVSHSQGGGLSLHAPNRQRELVRGCAMLEPHGLPIQVEPGLPGTPGVVVIGDFLDQVPYWVRMRRNYDASLAAWRAAGGNAEFWELPAMGILGNSHNMMMDLNSDRIVSLVIDWLDRGHDADMFD